MNVEINEVVVLMMIALGYIPITLAYVRRKHTRWLFLAYTTILIGALATVLEGFIFPKTLNHIEHIAGVMGAGVLFFICSYVNYKKITMVERSIRKKKVKNYD